MNKKVIISLVGLLVSAILVFVFIDPLWVSVKMMRSAIAQQKAELSKIEELLDKTQQLEQELEEVKEESQRIFFALPKEKDIPHLLIQFEALALSNGLLLESIKFGQIEETKKVYSSNRGLQGQSSLESIRPSSKLPLRSLSASLAISGSYSAFKKYLADLEKNIRSMDVNRVGLTAAGLGEGIGILIPSLNIFEFNLELIVYYQ